MSRMLRFLAILRGFFPSSLLYIFPATLLQLFFHPPSLHLAIYFFVYLFFSYRTQAANAPGRTAALCFGSSHLHRQVQRSERPLAGKEGTMGEKLPVIWRQWRLPRHCRGLLHSAFPSEGRHAEDFFRPEKSDGFGRVRTRELGYQRPPKPLGLPLGLVDSKFTYNILVGILFSSILCKILEVKNDCLEYGYVE
jgi:hypothetical protein